MSNLCCKNAHQMPQLQWIILISHLLIELSSAGSSKLVRGVVASSLPILISTDGENPNKQNYFGAVKHYQMSKRVAEQNIRARERNLKNNQPTIPEDRRFTVFENSQDQYQKRETSSYKQQNDRYPVNIHNKNDSVRPIQNQNQYNNNQQSDHNQNQQPTWNNQKTNQNQNNGNIYQSTGNNNQNQNQRSENQGIVQQRQPQKFNSQSSKQISQQNNHQTNTQSQLSNKNSQRNDYQCNGCNTDNSQNVNNKQQDNNYHNVERDNSVGPNPRKFQPGYTNHHQPSYRGQDGSYNQDSYQTRDTNYPTQTQDNYHTVNQDYQQPNYPSNDQAAYSSDYQQVPSPDSNTQQQHAGQTQVYSQNQGNSGNANQATLQGHAYAPDGMTQYLNNTVFSKIYSGYDIQEVFNPDNMANNMPHPGKQHVVDHSTTPPQWLGQPGETQNNAVNHQLFGNSGNIGHDPTGQYGLGQIQPQYQQVGYNYQGNSDQHQQNQDSYAYDTQQSQNAAASQNYYPDSDGNPSSNLGPYANSPSDYSGMNNNNNHMDESQHEGAIRIVNGQIQGFDANSGLHAQLKNVVDLPNNAILVPVSTHNNNNNHHSVMNLGGGNNAAVFQQPEQMGETLPVPGSVPVIDIPGRTQQPPPATIVARDAAVIATSLGQIKGKRVTSPKGVGVDAYLGIPYAERTGRFERPVPKLPWEGVLDASEYGDACAKLSSDKAGLDPTSSENCLYLKIIVPSNRNGQLLPVLFWPHGGGYTGGSNRDYDIGAQADNLLSKGVILAQPTYRVGPFGFWSTATPEAPGNYAMWDVLEALRFVNKEIHNFGGDPSRIVLAGQGAGGISSNVMTLSPLGRGLFKRAIMMSGTMFSPYTDYLENQNNRIYQQFATAAGCDDELNSQWLSGQRSRILDCLKNISAVDLAIATSKTNLPRTLAWHPRIDGAGGILPLPLDQLARERPVFPVLMGDAKDESSWDLLVSQQAYSTDVQSKDRNGNLPLPANLNQLNSPNAGRTECTSEVTERYFNNASFAQNQCIRNFVEDAQAQLIANGVSRNNYYWYQQAVKAGSSYLYHAPIIMDLAFHLANGNCQAYLYSLDYTRAHAGAWWKMAGAFHNFDLAFIEDSFPNNAYTFTKDARDTYVQSVLTGMIVAFAQTGNPSVRGAEPFNPLSLPSGFNYFSIDAPIAKMKPCYNSDDVLFWNQIIPAVAGERVRRGVVWYRPQNCHLPYRALMTGAERCRPPSILPNPVANITGRQIGYPRVQGVNRNGGGLYPYGPNRGVNEVFITGYEPNPNQPVYGRHGTQQVIRNAIGK